MKEKELFLYAILSFITSFVLLFAIVGGGFFYFKIFENMPENQKNITFFIIGFLIYLVSFFIVYFFNTAIISSVNRIINGQPNNFGDGIKDSMDNLGKIFQWSLVSSTVATILNILETREAIGKVVVSILGTSWSILSFFSFPLMILKGYGPIEAIKESGKLFKKTWGERAIIYVSTGLFFFLISIGFIAISVIIALTYNLWLGIGLGVISILFVILTNRLSNTIINTTLLYYAENGKLPEIVPNKEIFNYIISEKK